MMLAFILRKNLFGSVFLGALLVLSSASCQAVMSLADAYAAIATKKRVDLTHAFGPETPVWHGFGQATMAAAADPESHQPYTLEHDGFHTTFYAMVGQYGTHIDPPAHFDPKGQTMDNIPLEDMILPLIVIDMTPLLKAEPNHAFNLDDLRSWEQTHGAIPLRAFVALRTDMGRDFEKNPERFKRSPFPGWSLPVVKFLFESRGTVAIGHEALDTDTTETFDSEAWLLKHGHWQIEALTNLDKVPATGAVMVVTWPKVRGGFGFPARAFAILP